MLESVIPTLAIQLKKLKTAGYKVLGLTVNPIFFVAPHTALRIIPHGLLFLPPRREFEVWIELLLGHDEEGLLDVPLVEFRFNTELRAHERDPIFCRETADSPFQRNSKNYELYRHFWLSEESTTDLLVSGYGPDAERVISKDYPISNLDPLPQTQDWLRERAVVDNARFAMAFRRSSYRMLKSSSGLARRLNYPCSFQVCSTKETESSVIEAVTVQPRPFELATALPSYKVEQLYKHESISFWFYYSYSEKTAAQADAPDHDLFSFVHRLALSAEDKHPTMDINFFPRFPYRFRILHSTPSLVVSPRLERDPPPWIREDYSLYPMVKSQIINEPTEHDQSSRRVTDPLEMSFFLMLRDERTQLERNVGAIVYSLVIGVFMNFVANLATADPPLKETQDMVIFGVSSIFAGVFTYFLLAALRGRVGGSESLISNKEVSGRRLSREQWVCVRKTAVRGYIAFLVGAVALFALSLYFFRYAQLAVVLYAVVGGSVGLALMGFIYWMTFRHDA